jgi:hypothetical protein
VARATSSAVDVRVQELLDQIAVRRMQFHAVEAGVDRQRRGLCVFTHGSRDIGLRHRPRRTVRLHALGVCIHLARANLGRRADHLGTRGQIGDVSNTPGVHQLHEDLAALRVNGVGDGLPATHLVVIEQARDPRVAKPIR